MRTPLTSPHKPLWGRAHGLRKPLAKHGPVFCIWQTSRQFMHLKGGRLLKLPEEAAANSGAP